MRVTLDLLADMVRFFVITPGCNLDKIFIESCFNGLKVRTRLSDVKVICEIGSDRS